MPDTASQRLAVLTAARSWLGTPFHNLARVKGVGVDCAQLVAAAYEEAGLTSRIETGHYSPQHMLHGHEELLAEFVGRHAREIEESAVGPGDIVIYRVGRVFSHAAIVADWPRAIVHAHQLSGQVVEMGGFDADLKGRKTRFYSIWS